MDKKWNAIEMASCLANPQILLSKALANRNIQDFRAALEIGAHPLDIDEKKHWSVFETALKTAGCVEFVKECFKSGCDPSLVNTFFNKSVINYAADSRDPQIINAVLSHTGVNVDFKYAELTPLNSLAKNLTRQNVNDIFKCMQILLQYGASPNIPDQRDMTPLYYVVKNNEIDDIKKREIIQLLLSCPDLDIDTYRTGELRKIMEKKYPDMKLPIKPDNRIITYHTLLTHIRNNDMVKFQQQFANKFRYTTAEQNLELFMLSIERGAHPAFDVLLASGLNYNNTLGQNTALEIAWVYGNWYALDKLLKQTDIKLRSTDYPLSAIVRKLNETSPAAFCNYWKCFEVLLNSNKIDINQLDRSRSTALHYAVKYRNNEAIKELLKRGADISVKSVFNDLPIDGMSPDVLEEHFNSCIDKNDAKLGDEKFEIIINFRNLRPEKNSSHNLKKEMAPIAFMAKSQDYRHLLQHPVITSVLFLKWHKLSLLFYINFLLYLFYALSVITHAVLQSKEGDYETALAIFGMCSWFGICYLIIRESLQCVACPIGYVSSFANYVEVSLIILSILTMCKGLSKEHRDQIAVLTILLAAIELCLLVGSLPVSSISTHMLMLEAVCKSFVRSFLLYSIFIITFALCFYILNEKLLKETSNPYQTFSKTMVMFTGEFDSGDLHLDSFISYLTFLLFVFFMTIILFNLLNGLAVSDTQAIQDQAELNYIICRTQLLTRYEELLIERTGNAKSWFNGQPFRAICKYFINLYPDYGTGSQISILPNDNNKIVVPKPKSNNKKRIKEHGEENATIVLLTDEEDEHPQEHILPCCFSFITGKCSKMDERTVKLAMAVLERKSERNIESRLESMEEKLEKILKHFEGQE